jgi:hypothetical protein
MITIAGTNVKNVKSVDPSWRRNTRRQALVRLVCYCIQDHTDFKEERRMQKAAAGVLWIVLLCLPDLATAKPDAVPVFNVVPSCQEARAFAGDDKDLAYKGCMKDENDARAELAREWTHFKAGDRRDCVAQGAAPMPSYVEILTCLKMSSEANALYNPDGTARAKPGNASQGLSGPIPVPPSGNSPAASAPDGVPASQESPPAPKLAE